MPIAVYSGGSRFKRGQGNGATGGELRLARVSEDFVQPLFFATVFNLFPMIPKPPINKKGCDTKLGPKLCA